MQGPPGAIGGAGPVGGAGGPGGNGPAGPQGPHWTAIPFVTPPKDNDRVTVDVAGYAYVDMAIGSDGMPVISYAGAGDDLWVAHCSDVRCSGSVKTLVAATTPGNRSAITVGSDGLPVISYIDAAGDLLVVHCGTLDCSASTSNAIDAGSSVPLDSAIAIGSDGWPVVAYYENSGNIWVAHCSDLLCATSTKLLLDVGIGASIAIGTDGFPLISYSSGGSADLRVAHCGDSACTSSVKTSVDTSANNVGMDSSIVIGLDGLGVISYRDSTTANLWVAHCDNLDCTAATKVLVDGSANDVGQSSSMTLDPYGLPVIAYADQTAHTLVFAHCMTPSCATAIVRPIDLAPNIGQAKNISVEVGVDGLPVLAYAVSWDNDLRALHCSNPFCVPYFRRQ